MECGLRNWRKVREGNATCALTGDRVREKRRVDRVSRICSWSVEAGSNRDVAKAEGCLRRRCQRRSRCRTGDEVVVTVPDVSPQGDVRAGPRSYAAGSSAAKHL